jgi:hypothetical protein
MVEGHCQHAAGLLLEGTAPAVFVAGGRDGAAAKATTERFNASGAGSFLDKDPLLDAARAPASETLLPDTTAIWGGFGDTSLSATTKLRSYTANGQPIDQGDMRLDRGFHVVRRLLDRTVLVTGGTDNDAPAEGHVSIERMSPANVNGSFQFVGRNGATCTDPQGDDAATCVTMVAPRYGHQMVLIDGSQTWLNGAVVVAGGDAVPEIFVPAYACEGSSPVDVDGTVIAGVDFCDLGRPAVTLTPFDPPSN